ncbi:hypothetical protein LJ737_26250 [Hymenobacter sp. 15J16-1T3B]|uniref:DUF7010 family protein n=1 Tax=Hymenobacter sp. 15J16-1T3B TaxID=2886941 RepID=UPI001D107FEF|nr:hypothetical protein [Hymenobacter sp. 15J16-1T3B]MCC3160766.1 hypothetical protein [Hymenobacter sp. 15J16-1T3B]
MSAAAALDVYRLELSTKARNGVHFLAAATVVWLLIAGIWALPYSPTLKGLATFCAGCLVLPLAYLFGRLLGATWTVAGNPLQPLGLWLNFAQLFYFPVLIFMYMRAPQHFVMTYGIITGAHLFPFAWLYRTTAYAGAAGLIAAGCLVLELTAAPARPYLIPLFVALSLTGLVGLAYAAYRRNAARYRQAPAPATLAA